MDYFDMAQAKLEQEAIAQEHRRKRDYESQEWGFDVASLIIVGVFIVLVYAVLR